ncbi:PAS domain S-box-containing protein [Halogranum amylolyticum]|uniref:histidine kinase n=1 Tax=Halogranum amylolyticum TaxID=660520 RepID=A0A1H8NIV8_9EURY|nr:PAS domain-containing sensor histidine kinase [Halogranum amylolyticum]SEO29419.1 PAS domain S-box-containing protein [Halogranum amylolyticum]
MDDDCRSESTRLGGEPPDLSQTGRWFDALFRDPVGMVSLLAPDGTILHVNRTTVESLGVEERLLVGQSLPELPGWSDAARERVREALATAAGGELAQFEAQNRAFADGRWLHVSLWPAFADDGSVDALVSRGIDVTQERRTRQQRQRMKRQRDEERELLARVLETAPVAIFVMNRDREIVKQNGHLQRLLDEIGVDSVTQLTDSDRVTLLDADGTPLETPRLVSDRVFETGRPVGVEYVVDCRVDITEQERQHQTLQRSKQRITVLNRVLRHDIRTRSNVVGGYADLIAARVDADSPLREFADVVAETASELSELSDTARKIEQIVGEVDGVEPVALDTLLAEALETFERTYPSVPVDLDVPASVTALGTPSLAEAFYQLLKNAAVHNGGDRPRISLAVRTPETATDPVEVRIADNGPGIPVEEVTVIEQGEEDQLNHGSGLGLWFVNWVVDGVGGSLAFETGDGGTTVVVRLRPSR